MNSELNLQKFIIAIVLVGITLVLGIYITNSIQNAVDTDVTVNGTYANESLGTITDGTAVNFAIITTAPSADCSGVIIVNGSGGETIDTGNYTLPTTCSVIALAGSNYNNTAWNVSYAYSYESSTATSASNASGDIVTALTAGTAWISILVVVGFAVIVLNLLTSGLGNAARREEETPYY